MRALLLAAPILLAAVMGSAAEEPPSWKPFSSEEGQFRILLPDQPVVTHASRSTFLGKIPQTRHETLSGVGEVSIDHHDLPGIAIDMMPDSVILDQAGENLIEAVGGTQSLERAYTWNGHAAREITYEVPGDTPMLERCRLILVEARLYLVIANWPAPQAIPDQLVAFFDSFELMKAADPTAPVGAGFAD